MEKNWLLNLSKCGALLFFSMSSCIANAKSFSGFGAEVDSYIRLAANQYQVSEAMLRGLVKFENGWTGNISPTGATGVGQFTVGTWNWLSETERGREIGMRPVTKYNRGTAFDPRKNKYINTLATALLARWHIEQFSERRIPASDENLYMAHNIGLDGLHRALLGQSTRKDIENMRKNGMKPWMTVSEFMVYQKGRYNEHKSAANFYALPTNITAKNASTIVATSGTQPKKNTRLVLPAKIRYVDNSSAKLNWVEPSDSKLVWVSPSPKN